MDRVSASTTTACDGRRKIMVTLTINLDDNVMIRLEAEAHRRGATVAQLITMGAHLVADAQGIELTDEEEAAVEAADAEMDRGEYVTEDEVMEKLAARRQ
jgi:predicted transcriptional regulator